MSNGICSGTGAGAAGGCCAEATLDTVAMATPASRLNVAFFMVPPLERAQFFVAMLAKGAAKGYRSLERSGDPAAVGRPIDDIGAIDDIVARDETDFAIAAVDGVVAIVPEHEIAIRRHDEFIRVVVPAAVPHLGNTIVPPIRHALDVPDRGISDPLGPERARDPLAGKRRAVEVDHAAAKLHAVAGQTDDAFEIFDAAIRRKMENGEIAALRRLGPRIPFRHDVLARLDGRHHRRAWNGERSPGAESRGIGEE